MVQVEAIAQFEHYGARALGAVFHVDQRHATALIAKHLVREIKDEAGNPRRAIGMALTSSASPVAPASPSTTLTLSGAGATLIQTPDGSSSRTPPIKRRRGPTHSHSSTESGGRVTRASLDTVPT